VAILTYRRKSDHARVIPAGIAGIQKPWRQSYFT